jgi:hypothetical protein
MVKFTGINCTWEVDVLTDYIATEEESVIISNTDTTHITNKSQAIYFTNHDIILPNTRFSLTFRPYPSEHIVDMSECNCTILNFSTINANNVTIVKGVVSTDPLIHIINLTSGDLQVNADDFRMILYGCNYISII